MVTLQLRQLSIPPGQHILLKDISWSEFETILEELGDKRASRISYYQGVLEIRMLLPEHEVDKEIIGDMIKILLEELEIDCECFGSTTFKREDRAVGIELDNNFYLKNYRLMIGQRRLDLRIDPPPDLAIEVDLTSKTKLAVYEALGVPELWRYEDRKLRIHILQNSKYIQSKVSLNFPDLQIIEEEISRFLAISLTEGRSSALRAFRQWVRERVKQ